MKRMLVVLTLLLSMNVIGRTFYVQSQLNLRTTSINILKDEVQITVLNTFNDPRTGEKLIKLVVDEKEVVVALVKGDTTATYQAYIDTLYRYSGGVCDELETVKLVATIKDHYDARDPHSYDAFEVTKVKAIRNYYYDSCHDLSPEKEEVSYTN